MSSPCFASRCGTEGVQTPKPRILYVEDNPDLIALVQLILSRQGMEVIGARGVPEALELLDTVGSIHLFLVDISMPVFSGWDFLAMMDKDERFRDVPRVLMSGYNVHDRSQGREPNHDYRLSAFLNKPCSPSQLSTVIWEVLCRSRSSRADADAT